MTGRNVALYVAAGALAGGMIAWSAMRVVRSPAPAEPARTKTAAPSLAPPQLESVPRISIADFRQRLDRGELVVIDVRDAEQYTAAHIPGAMHIPLSFVQGELPYLPRGKPIVTYCT